MTPLLLLALATLAPQDTVERTLQARLDSYRTATGVPGAVLGVAFPDGRVVAIASGIAAAALKRPLRPDARLLMGRRREGFVAAVAMRLVREENSRSMRR
ncbi:MAG: hypothetical protein IPP98_09715 [Gemmatimonadetes bacterium]|nr:hypothetical protein [Gemmatimonadota bacterium]